MSALAPELGRWGALTDLLEPECAGFVGTTSGLLGSLFGPLRERTSERGAAVEGYAGFTRRGSYERLLLSEWLFADEAPDEFLRRAADGEHVFHALARRDPHVARTILVLLDVGPEQIGAPRLAHVAALVALDRRAARADARVLWGSLGDPDAPPREGIDANGFAGFLGLHRDRPPARDAAIRAHAMAAARTPISETWILGGPSASRLDRPPDTRVVVVDEDGLRSGRRLTVSLEETPRRSLALELPSPEVGARLLRDPFATRAEERRTMPAPAPSGVVFDLSTPVRLLRAGARLAGRTVDGHVAFLGGVGLGSTIRPHPWVTKLEANEVAIAVGYLRKEAVVVSLRGQELVERIGSGRPTRRVLRPLGSRELADDREPLGTLVYTEADARRGILVGARRSFALDQSEFPHVTLTPSDAVRAVALEGRRERLRHATAMLLRTGGDLLLQRVGGHPAESPRPLGSFSTQGEVHVALDPRERRLVIAVVRDDDEVHITRVALHASRSSAVTWSSHVVPGFVGLSVGRGGPFAITVSERRIATVELPGLAAPSAYPKFVRTYPEPIRAVEVAPERPIVAVTTSSGRIEVVEVDLGRTLIDAEGVVR